MHAAYIVGLSVPIALGERPSDALKNALPIIIANVDDPIVGHTCRELLDGQLGDIHNPKLRIVELDWT